MRKLESGYISRQVLPESFIAVRTPILVPIEDCEERHSHGQAFLDLPLILSKVKEIVTVDLRLAQHDLEKLQIGFVLLIDVSGFLAVSALINAVVVALQLSDDALVPMTTLNTDEEVLLVRMLLG